MLAKKTDFGYIVWLAEDEINSQAVQQEIERLKASGMVVVLRSGGLEVIQVIEKLLQENKAPAET